MDILASNLSVKRNLEINVKYPKKLKKFKNLFTLGNVIDVEHFKIPWLNLEQLQCYIDTNRAYRDADKKRAKMYQERLDGLCYDICISAYKHLVFFV